MDKKKAIFLDRDGTLIEDKGYEHRIETLRVLPGVVDGLNLLKKDYLFFIITNQPGIEKGIYTQDDFHEFNNHLVGYLKNEGITIEKSYFCPHVEGCDCRKPSIKFINEIVSTYPVNLSESWVMGDHPSDIVMGINAGCRTAYLLTGHGEEHFEKLKREKIKPTIISDCFKDAAGYIDSGRY